MVSDMTVGVTPLAPNFTLVAPVKIVPVIVTDVPPASGPTLGETLVTDGGSLYVNLSDDEVGEVPIFVVTVMSICPAAWAGEVASICVSDTNV